LSDDLKPDRIQPKGLIVHCRILWALSAVHRARPERVFQQMAGRFKAGPPAVVGNNSIRLEYARLAVDLVG
jgi:hypothetical protein